MTGGPPHYESADFSLTTGGLLYRLYLGTGLVRPPLDSMRLPIIAATLIAWVPLLLLSSLAGLPAGDHVPFLYDIETHVRFLVAVPLLIGADLFVHRRLRRTVSEFVDSGIVAPDDLPKFNAAIELTIRLRNSPVIEIAILVFVYTIGHIIWRQQFALGSSTWYAIRGDAGMELTPAGYWFAFVSIPIYQFFLFRWYARLAIWFRFLWRVSQLDLRLNPTHPDRAGGLEFVGSSALAFAPILLAQGAMVAGLLANRIFHEGQNLLAFKVDVAGLVVFAILFVLGPLTLFIPNLVQARSKGKREYGELATRYVRDFEAKWIRGGLPERGTILGSSDIQSLADLADSYQLVDAMRPLPFGTKLVTKLALITIAPLLPLTLTVVPLEAMVDRLIKALL